MILTICLSKEVPDEATAQMLVDFVKNAVEQYPNVRLSAAVNNKVTPTEVPEP